MEQSQSGNNTGGIEEPAMTDASVVICTYTLDRWAELTAAVASVRRQTRPAREIFVVVDHNEALRERAEREIEGVTVVANTKAPGLSGGRMTGAELATAPIVVFLDDDAAAADQYWLAYLLEAYRDTRVLGVGGHIEPLWRVPPPPWFPPEFNWVIGCTYTGMPVQDDGRVRNLIGANMSIRADVLGRVGGFEAELGRRESGGAIVDVAMGSCEETGFCIQASRLYSGGIWVYCPKARVTHVVSAQRATWRYFVRRCITEGTAKAVLTGLTGSRDGLRSERRYILTLGRAVLRDIVTAKIGRAVAICAGLSITTTAYARARLTRAMARDHMVGQRF